MDMEKEIEEEEVNPPTIQRIFGDSTMARVLDFLTLYRRLDYSKTDIAKNSSVGWKTLFRLWPTLEKYGLVKMTRRIGRAQLYRLNMENPIAKTLTQLALQIADHDNEPIIKEQLAKEVAKVEAEVEAEVEA
jgi:hypothetical protein